MEEDNIVAKALKTQLTTFQEMEKENRKLVKDNEYLRYYRTGSEVIKLEHSQTQNKAQ